MTLRTRVVISDNIQPRCGHRGSFQILYTNDKNMFVAVVECPKRACKAAWVWGRR